MKKFLVLMSLMSFLGLVGCSGDEVTCPDGSTAPTEEECPAGDDDTAAT